MLPVLGEEDFFFRTRLSPLKIIFRLVSTRIRDQKKTRKLIRGELGISPIKTFLHSGLNIGPLKHALRKHFE